MAVVFYVLAVLFALYCIGVIASKAAGTKFFLVWIAAAILCAGTGVLLQKGLWERLPQPARVTALAVLGGGLACFVAVECFIVSGFFAEGSGNLPYIVVLGAQMKENGPSVALAKRLDRAYEYLQENPYTFCVLSGGKGENEPVSEAEGMYAYLVEKGIGADRLILEDSSRNTVQNIKNSRELIPDGIENIGIVTSNFHVFRGVRLAKANGFSEAEGIAAPSGVYFLPNNMLREFFGVMKDWLFGNM